MKHTLQWHPAFEAAMQRELDPRENVWLSRLRQDLQMERDVEVLARAYRGKDSDPLYSAVMDLIVRANWKMYKEGEPVCDALNELFADKLEAKRVEGKYESLNNLLKNSPSLSVEEGAKLLGFSSKMMREYKRLAGKLEDA